MGRSTVPDANQGKVLLQQMTPEMRTEPASSIAPTQ
jgi:hypothetical protein